MTEVRNRVVKKRQPPRLNEDLLHSLRNTLGAIQIRVSMISSDPTCRWAQEQNLTAVTRLVGEALVATRQLGEPRSAERPRPKKKVAPKKVAPKKAAPMESPRRRPGR
jgi:hypothetical protein